MTREQAVFGDCARTHPIEADLVGAIGGKRGDEADDEKGILERAHLCFLTCRLTAEGMEQFVEHRLQASE